MTCPIIPENNETLQQFWKEMALAINTNPEPIQSIAIVLHTDTQSKAYQFGMDDNEFSISAMLILEHLHKPLD